MFDKIIVAVGTNTQKGKGLPASRRVALATEVLKGIDNVEVVSFDGLLTILFDHKAPILFFEA